MIVHQSSRELSMEYDAEYMRQVAEERARRRAKLAVHPIPPNPQPQPAVPAMQTVAPDTPQPVEASAPEAPVFAPVRDSGGAG